MKLSCLQENLSRALAAVSRAVAARSSTLPILTHVSLSTDNGRLKVSATNLEIGITCWIGAAIESEGAITVPARTLANLVGLLPPGKVDLSADSRNQSLVVQSGRTRDVIKGIDASEFPIIPAFSRDGAAFIDPMVLKKLVNQVVFAASTDESRPTLTGVLLRMHENAITFAATDQFRLSIRKGVLLEPVAASHIILVPARAIAEVGRLIGAQSEPVAIAVTPSNGQVLFHLSNCDLVAQLIDQKFPNFEQIIPRRHDTRCVVSTVDLLNACRRADLFAGESFGTIRISARPGEDVDPGKVLVSAHGDATGDNLSELEASVSGVPIDISFNARYVTEVLGVIDLPQVTLETTAPRSPALLRVTGDDDFTHVLMPINTPRS